MAADVCFWWLNMVLRAPFFNILRSLRLVYKVWVIFTLGVVSWGLQRACTSKRLWPYGECECAFLSEVYYIMCFRKCFYDVLLYHALLWFALLCFYLNYANVLSDGKVVIFEICEPFFEKLYHYALLLVIAMILYDTLIWEIIHDMF